MSRPTKFYRLPCGCRVRWIRVGSKRQVHEQHPCQEHTTMDIKPVLRRLLDTPPDVDAVIDELFSHSAAKISQPV